MASTNSFNFGFFKRLFHLLHVFLPFSIRSSSVPDHDERIYSNPSILILLILVNGVGLQFVIYFVGLLPSAYYAELTKEPDQRNLSIVNWLIVRSFFLIILNAFLKSLSTLLSSILYVRWRTRLVLYLHSFYFTQQRYYHVSNTTQQNPNRREDDTTVTQINYTIQT